MLRLLEQHGTRLRLDLGTRIVQADLLLDDRQVTVFFMAVKPSASNAPIRWRLIRTAVNRPTG
ncbi:MAG: hypothetical protein R3E89_16310 [Thiolinea sp.]